MAGKASLQPEGLSLTNDHLPVFQFITKLDAWAGGKVRGESKKQAAPCPGIRRFCASSTPLVIFGSSTNSAVSSRPIPSRASRRKETRQLVVPEELALARLRCDPNPWVTAVRAAPVATAPHPASRNPSATPLSWTPTVHPGAFAIGSMRSTCVELLKHDPRHREQNKLQRRLQRCQQLYWSLTT